MTRVLEINDPSQLENYRLLWQSLLPATPGASFFHSLDWLQTYWQFYGHDQTLRVFIVYSAGQPVGILPLVVRSESTRLGSVRVLTYPLNDWGTFYGPIGPNPTATLVAGLGHIRRTTRDWDLLDLRWVDRFGRDYGRTRRAMNVAGFPHQELPMSKCAKIDLHGTWDQYWASRTSHWRTNVRSCERKLAALGRVSYVRYRPDGIGHGDDNPRWDLYDACEQVARASWQGSSTSGTTLTHPEIRDYLRAAHETAVKAGAADINLLYVDDRPVAFNYAYQYRGYVFGLRMGYDPQVSNGAGTVLQRRMIEDCFARGDRTYDLGADYLSCKRFWPTRFVESYRYTYYPARPVAQALRVKRRIGAWLSADGEASNARASKSTAAR